MTVATALKQRSSVRDYLPEPVPDATLRRLLDQALQAPSWANTQPYKVAIAQGEIKEAIKLDLLDRHSQAQDLMHGSILKRAKSLIRGKALPRGDYRTLIKYPRHLLERRRETGFGLYSHLGIKRNDYAGRDAQMRRNFEFFGAPVILFIFANKALGEYSALDAGIFLQSLMLSAEEEGLATCAMGSVATWSAPIKERFEVPDGYGLLCGLSLGFASEHKINAYRPARVSVDELLMGPVSQQAPIDGAGLQEVTGH